MPRLRRHGTRLERARHALEEQAASYTGIEPADPELDASWLPAWRRQTGI